MSEENEAPRERLVVRGLCKAYETPAGPSPVLRDVDLTVRKGESAAIVGPSGSGKSTLLNILGSLDRPDSGSVTLDGVDVTGLQGDRLAAYRRSSVGFVFQDHHLLPQCTALENVLLPVLAGTPKVVDVSRGTDLLGAVGLADRAGSFPDELSGGERQRVAVARALVNQPALLLGDEPTGNLDRENGERIVELFLQLAETQAATLVMVTHNLALAERLGSVHHLTDGRLGRG